MNDLIVIGYPDEHRAYDVWAELVKRHDYLVDLEDAAIIWRDENGKVHVTTPAHHAVAKGTVSGLFWGTLIGLLFMFPLAPLAGGIMGAALGAAWRLGIKDDFRQRGDQRPPVGGNRCRPSSAGIFCELLEFTRPGPDVAGMYAVKVHQQEVARPGGRAGIPVTQTTPALFDACASSGR